MLKLRFRLLCITDRHATKGRDIGDLSIELIQAGLRGLQVREKDMPDASYRHLMARIQDAAKNMPMNLFVNSRVDAAREFKTGLHLPDGADIAAARRELGPDVLIGASCHTQAGAEAAAAAGASFVVFGPVFKPISKLSATAPHGLDVLSDVCKSVPVPVVALGGITPKNAVSCIQSGAQAVAAVGSIWTAPDVSSALWDFMKVLGRF